MNVAGFGRVESHSINSASDLGSLDVSIFKLQSDWLLCDVYNSCQQYLAGNILKICTFRGLSILNEDGRTCTQAPFPQFDYALFLSGCSEVLSFHGTLLHWWRHAERVSSPGSQGLREWSLFHRCRSSRWLSSSWTVGPSVTLCKSSQTDSPQTDWGQLTMVKLDLDEVLRLWGNCGSGHTEHAVFL